MSLAYRKTVTFLNDGHEEAAYLLLKRRKRDKNFSKLYNDGALRLANGGLSLWGLRLFLYFLAVSDSCGYVPVCSQRIIGEDLGTTQGMISKALMELTDKELIWVDRIDQESSRLYWIVNPAVAKKS